MRVEVKDDRGGDKNKATANWEFTVTKPAKQQWRVGSAGGFVPFFFFSFTSFPVRRRNLDTRGGVPYLGGFFFLYSMWNPFTLAMT